MGEPKVTSEQLPMAGKYRHQIGGNHGFDRKKKKKKKLAGVPLWRTVHNTRPLLGCYAVTVCHELFPEESRNKRKRRKITRCRLPTSA